MSTIPDDYLDFEKDDFKRGLLINEHGWHPVKVLSYEKKEKEKTVDGVKQKYILHVYTFQGLDEDAGRKGVFLRWNVSSNAPKSIHAQIINALDPDARRQASYKYNPNNAVGKVVDAFINTRLMDEADPDSIVNNIKNFRTHVE